MSYLEELDLEEEGLTEEEIKKRKTKIFVGGLKYSSKDDVLKEYFSQFGEIEEAVVIYDRESGLSKGYGFVTMSTDEAAELAIRDKSPRLDGRRCNVNLAYIGQKKKNNGLTGKGKALGIQGHFTSPSYLQNGYQQKILANGQVYYTPASPQVRYPVYGHQIGLPYLNQCQHAYYAIPGSSPTYEQRDPNNPYMQPYVLTQQFVVAGSNAANGYTAPANGTAPTTSNNNNNNVPNYNQVAFIGQYPVLMETSTNPVGQVTTTAPTYAASPGPSCTSNGSPQVFHFHQQEIVNQ